MQTAKKKKSKKIIIEKSKVSNIIYIYIKNKTKSITEHILPKKIQNNNNHSRNSNSLTAIIVAITINAIVHIFAKQYFYSESFD